MKTTKYILLVRSKHPIPRLDGKKSYKYNWYVEEEGSLGCLRKVQNGLEFLSEKTKIIREETTISVVKSGDLK